MISIRDADKQRLIYAMESLDSIPGNRYARHIIADVLKSIDELSQMAPVIEPLIVPMSEEDKRICYPERYK
jgi:hypothetical protein